MPKARFGFSLEDADTHTYTQKKILVLKENHYDKKKVIKCMCLIFVL